MYPCTKALKSPMMPILDTDGAMKPAVLLIAEEALSAGVDEVREGLGHAPARRRPFRRS